MPPDIILTVSEEIQEIELEIVDGETKLEESITVVPSYEQQNVVPREGYVLGEVVVEPIPDPVSIMRIEDNGIYDVRRYGTADVQVPQGMFPSGTLDITENGVKNVEQYESVNVNVPQPSGTINILQNGQYDVSQYASANVNTNPPKGVSLGFNDEGYVTECRVYGFGANMPEDYAAYLLHKNGLGKRGTVLYVDASITKLTRRAFYYCSSITSIIVEGDVTSVEYWFTTNAVSLASVVFMGEIGAINNVAFYASSNIMLYDFSHCTSVTQMASASYLVHKAGCVIKVPSALLSAWQTADGWKDLTDVVWEGV